MLHPTRLGTAQLTAPDAIEQNFPYRTGSFWLGRSVIRSGDDPYADGLPIGADDDRHFLLVGGTRGGKGQSLIVPNLCLWPGSVFCVDPKGENAMLTADARAEGRNGRPQKTYVLDPFATARIDNPALRASFNPLWELMEPDPHGLAFGEPGDEDYEPAFRPVEQAVDEAAIVASAIVVNGDGKGKSDHWNDNARRMVSALILHVVTAPRFLGQRNLVTVRQLIMRGAEDLAEICRAVGKEVGSNQGLLWNDVAGNEAFGGVIHEDGAFFADMAANDPEQFSGVVSTAATHTEFLRSPQLRATLKTSAFRLEALKTDPAGISVYLCLPLRYIQAEHYRWLRMLIGLATQQMEKTPGSCAAGHKVLMMLDEFTSLRRMSYLEEALTQYGGAGLKMFIAVQTLDRLRAVYPDGWQSFVSQCGVKCFFNADDSFTREEISKLAGETEIVIEGRSSQKTDTVNDSWTINDTNSSGSSGGASDTSGRNTSRAVADNWTEGNGGGTARSQNRSQGGGTSEGFSHGTGGSRSRGVSTGVSQETWNSLLFGKQFASKSTVSSSQNYGESENWQDSKSFQSQENWQTSSGETLSDQWNKGRGGGTTDSRGDNASHSEQRGWQTGTAHAEGKGGGTARATGSGTSEQWHRRPLFMPEEIGRFFAATEDKRAPFYPGLALILKGGGVSLIVRRVNYYEDRRFVGLFNPHQDYLFTPLPPLPGPVALLAPEPEILAPLALPPPASPRLGPLAIILGVAQVVVILLLVVSGLVTGLHDLRLWLGSFDLRVLIGFTWLALTGGLWGWFTQQYWIDGAAKRLAVAAALALLPLGLLAWLSPYYLRLDAWAAALSAAFRHGFAAHWLLTALGVTGLLVFDVHRLIHYYGDD